MIPAALALLAALAGTDVVPMGEHEAIVGELSRELGLTTVKLRETKLELGGCTAKLEARPSFVPAPLPPPAPEGWTGLEVVGISAVVALVAGAVGLGLGALVAQ